MHLWDFYAELAFTFAFPYLAYFFPLFPHFYFVLFSLFVARIKIMWHLDI